MCRLFVRARGVHATLPRLDWMEAKVSVRRPGLAHRPLLPALLPPPFSSRLYLNTPRRQRLSSLIDVIARIACGGSTARRLCSCGRLTSTLRPSQQRLFSSVCVSVGIVLGVPRTGRDGARTHTCTRRSSVRLCRSRTCRRWGGRWCHSDRGGDGWFVPSTVSETSLYTPRCLI